MRVFFFTIPIFLFIAGCASVYKPQNKPITVVDGSKGYRQLHNRYGDPGDHLVLLAFSGGGTRAAALSYGVLKELRDTQIDGRVGPGRLLDEVDSISSVSGGSFTAAYYGLFGERLFSDYEKVFLKQSIQGSLIQNLFDPSYWWKSVFSGFDRTEMAIDYYDKYIFEGKKFSDMRLNDGPYIEINATDLGGGTRFSFIQAYFDFICSDLESFSVARAVTASSAVPIAFPPVVLKNHAGACDPSQTKFVSYVLSQTDEDARTQELQQRIKAYGDRKKNGYIQLVDGGVSDNLGLRALTDRIEGIGSGQTLVDLQKIPKNILVISVDAAVLPEHTVNETATKPSVTETFEAFSDAQFRLYNDETRLLLQTKLKDLQAFLKAQGRPTEIYMANISFSSVQLDSLKTYLNRLPTSLELSDHDVDMLTEVGGQLLRNSPGYRDFLRKNGGRRRVSPVNRSSLGLSAAEQGQQKPLVAKGNKQRASMMRTKSQPAQG
jgi:NTE family protein